MNKPVQEQLNFKPTFTNRMSFMVELRGYSKNHTLRQIKYRFDFRKIGLNINSLSGVRDFLNRNHIPFKKIWGIKPYLHMNKNDPKFHKIKKYAPSHTLRQISHKFHYKSTPYLADYLSYYRIPWIKTNSKKYTKMLAAYSKNHNLTELAKEFCYNSRGSALNALNYRGIHYSRYSHNHDNKQSKRKKSLIMNYNDRQRKNFIKKLKKYAPSHNLRQVFHTFGFKSQSSARTFLDKHGIPFIKLKLSNNKHSLTYWNNLLNYVYSNDLKMALHHFSYKDLNSLMKSVKVAHNILQSHNQHTFVGKTKNLIENVKFYRFMYKYKSHQFAKMTGKCGSVSKKYAHDQFLYRQKINELKRNHTSVSKIKIKAKKYDKLVKLINSSSN